MSRPHSSQRIRPVLLSLLVPGVLAFAPTEALANSVAFPPLIAKGVEPKVSTSVTSMISSELDFSGSFDTLNEIAAPASLNAACLASTSCLAGIAKGAGSDHVVAGSIGPGPDGVQVFLVWYDAKKNAVVRKKTFNGPLDLSALADSSGKWVKELVTGQTTAQAKAEDPVPTNFDAGSGDEDDFAFEKSSKPAATTSTKAATKTRIETKAQPKDLEDDDLASADDEADREEAERLDAAQRAKEAAAAKAAAQAKAKADAEAKVKAEAEAKRRAEEEAQARAEEEARKAAEAKARAAAAKAEAERLAREEEEEDRAREAARVAAAKSKSGATTSGAAASGEEDFQFGSSASLMVMEEEGEEEVVEEPEIELEEEEPAPRASSSSRSSSSASRSSGSSSSSRTVSRDSEDLDDLEALDEEENFAVAEEEEEEPLDLDEDRPSRSSSRSRDDDDRSSRSSSRDSGSSRSSRDSSSRSSSSRRYDDLDRETRSRPDDDDKPGTSLGLRLGYSRYYQYNFVTYGGEINIPVASTVGVVIGIEGFSTQREIGEQAAARMAREQGVDVTAINRTPWNVILPINIGVVYKNSAKSIHPYIGVDATLTPYTEDFDIAFGARARAGADFMVAKNFGLNLNVAAGVMSGAELDQTEDGVGNLGFIPQISGGTVFQF